MRRFFPRAITLVFALGIWFSPLPEGIAPAAWHLFALFAAAILSVVIGAFPILTACVLARAVVQCGLGERLGQLVIRSFGRSTLGLGYSIFPVDGVIAPAFPCNTARSGVLYPLVLSVAEAAGARPGDESRRRLGSFLMFSGMASLTVSSALWLTAMAANPLGAEIARAQGLTIDFGSWLVASSVPTLVAMGPLRAHEKIVVAVFIGCVGLAAGPSFVSGLRSTGPSLVVTGLIVALTPHVVAVLFGRYVLRMNPVILLGACAGAGTVTAALRAIQDEAGSKLPVLGYTVPYAIGNILLTAWGPVIVLLTR